MRRYVPWTGLFSVLIAWDTLGCVNPVEAASQAPGTRVLLLTHPSVDAGVVSNALTWAEQNTYVQWKHRVGAFEGGQTVDALMADLATENKPEWFGVIGLGPLDKSVTAHEQVDTNRMVAVVNTTALAHEDTKIFTRRLERMLIRGYASLLGVGHSPNPRCCLFDYKQLAHLDQIGRNCCPPFEIKMRKLGNQQGVAARALPRPPAHLLRNPATGKKK